jgi:putative transposase
VSIVADEAKTFGVKPACEALGLPRATFYRRSRPMHGPAQHRSQARGLTREEKARVVAVLTEPRFADLSPAEVYATLLDEGTYLCSERTMYRVLAENSLLRERRDQLRHPAHPAPQILATRPNELWSWDITKLLGPAKWTYFYLYVVMDVFSRYVVGWMIAGCCEREAIQAGQLTIHADRGTSMTSKPVAFLLADLGVTKTHSRPHVSNDNPFSEAAFKTLKYRPDFPERFGSIEDARGFCADFFRWYNEEHRHSGIELLTPSDVHHGRAAARLEARRAVMATAFAARPERFVRGAPHVAALPNEVWINNPATTPQKQKAAQ